MASAIILRLGNEQFTLHPCGAGAQKVLQRLVASPFNTFLSHYNEPNIKGNYLAITDSLKFSELTYPKHLPANEYLVWADFYNGLVASHQLKMISLGDEQDGDKTSIFFGSFNNIYSSNVSDQESQPQISAIYIGEKEESAHLRLMVCAIFISTLLHVKHGGLCLHSAAVSRRGKGFLFLGESGAGKSTVTKMSESVGCLALGDDLNFVLQTSKGGHQIAMAWPYSEGDAMLRPPLLGVFKLVQDKHDYLVRLSSRQAATELFYVFKNQTSYTPRLPNDIFRFGFHTICDITRSVPIYELHFRKSPDFWKLIDEQFPN